MTSVMRVALLLLTASACFAQTAWFEPPAPRIGDQITIFYDANVGSLNPTGPVWMHWGGYDFETADWSTPPSEIWPEGSLLHTDNVALQSPMTDDGSGVFAVTIDMDDATEAIALAFTDRADNWDNNGGSNWILLFRASGEVSWWDPEDPVPGDEITILYDAVAGTLPDGVSEVILHWGIDETGPGAWQLAPEEIRPPGTIVDGIACRTPMVNEGNGLWSLVIDTTPEINSIHYVTNSGANWDNNGSANWNIVMEEPPPVEGTKLIFRFDPRGAFAGAFVGNVNSLNLAGTFNGWSTGATPLTDVDPYGNFYGEVEVPVGDLEYKFVINGNNWQIDPDNPRNAPGGFNNSLLTVVLDESPQVYGFETFENHVFTDENPPVTREFTYYVRPGDLGPGIETVEVQLAALQSYDAATGEVIVEAGADDDGVIDIVTIVTDSSDRETQHWLSYGQHPASEGFLAVDPLGDLAYPLPDGSGLDLHAFSASEVAGGDSIEFTIVRDNNTNDAQFLLTISAETGTFGPVHNLDCEIEVPSLAGGGLSILILNESDPNFNAGIHNRIHPGDDIMNPGPAVEVELPDFQPKIHVRVATADLIASLGSYQTEWYYTCSSMRPGSSANGYCYEITEADGGIDGEEDPDVYDTIFMMAADLETKMFKNYGLVRRVTLDAPGRGVAAIHPDQIGPNIATPGPVCEVLTRGVPTTVASQSVSGRVTSDETVTEVYLETNGVPSPVTLTQDTFTVDVTLEEGPNTFSVWAVDVNSDTGRSAAMIYTLIIDHSPKISLHASIGDASVLLDASETTDPDNDITAWLWEADPDNPEEVGLNNANSSEATFTLPGTPGEYYFDLTVTDAEGNESHGRTFIRKFGSAGASPFLNDETAAWVDNAIMYEIFVRSFSPQGDFDGVTTRIPQLADLGIDVIWLMPIFEGPSDHGYEITDYYTLEQDYGSEEDFRELVETCHDWGIRVIIDMVINHTGIGHPFMQDAIRNGVHSHYYDWYDRDQNGNYTYYFDWASLPNINHDDPECAQYWIDMCAYWIKEFDIDGYRCDVAWGPQERTPQFWIDWRQQLKEIKPEVMLFAEAGANDFTIFDNRFDLANDWNLRHESGASLINMFPSVPDFNALTDLITNYGFPWPQYKSPLRFLENHDEFRYITEFTPAQTRFASALVLSIPGVPMLYAGQEIGFPSQRGTINWASDPDNMYPHYYRLTNARKRLPAMRIGDFTVIENSAGPCYSFARTMNGEFPVIFTGNFGSTSQLVSTYLDHELLDIEEDSTYVVSDLLTGNTQERLGSELDSLFTSISSYSVKVWVIADSAIVLDGQEVTTPEIPTEIHLGSAYPNPFNPTTNLPLELNRLQHVKVTVYDVLGREVEVLVDGVLQAGNHVLQWDGSSNGVASASGIYFAVLSAENTQQVRKLVLLK